MSAPGTISPAIDFADRILRECGDAGAWPQGREAFWALHWARTYLIAALAEHQELLQDTRAWSSEEEDAALEAAERTAEDAAKALEKRWLEYWGREVKVIAARGEAA